MRHIRTDGSAEPSCGAIAARITVNTAARPHRPDDILVRKVLTRSWSPGRILRLTSPAKTILLVFLLLRQGTPLARAKERRRSTH